MPEPNLLAIDQGTTSTRALVYDAAGRVLGSAATELTQHYPQPGWVEHDPEEIWAGVAETVPEAVRAAGIDFRSLAAIGLTNQRETVLIWDRRDGTPVGRALVWQDRRTADFCRERRADEPWIHSRTGLLLDPYFSGTKIRWMLQQSADLRGRAERGQLACGTVDSYLLWRLTGGAVHATDVTNASRTSLLDLRSATWDPELCAYFSVPPALLPDVRASSGEFGATRGLQFLPDGLSIAGVAGDQQASLFGQAGFDRGVAKCTYGTGAFLLIHTGPEAVASRHRLLTTIAATAGGQLMQYALEGSVFIAGAAVQWLRDGLGLIADAAAIEPLAGGARTDEDVILVPALAGLGAPHWVPEARGVLFGITRGTDAAQLARATLEGVAFQIGDLAEAARADAAPIEELRVDGGMAANRFFVQLQADILGIPLFQSAQRESTALGAALLAGLGAGVWRDQSQLRTLTGEATRFEPGWTSDTRERAVARWRRAVKAAIAFYQPAGG